MTSTFGYVYVVRETRTGLYKIGITGNLQRRMRQLGVGRTATLVDHIRCADPRSVERDLHRRHAKHRIPQTEYFHLERPPVLPREWVPTPRRAYVPLPRVEPPSDMPSRGLLAAAAVCAALILAGAWSLSDRAYLLLQPAPMERVR